MPQPSPSDVHVNRPLTNVSVAYQQNASAYVADRIFPRVVVPKQSDQYFVYPKGEWFREDVALRAPGTETPGTGYTPSTDTYFAHVYGVHRNIDDQTRANADIPLNLDREATQFVTNQLLLKRDKLFLAKYFTTGVWDTDKTGVTSGPTGSQFIQWDQAASDPVQDVHDGVLAVEGATGLRPNVMLVGPEVHSVLVNHADVLDRIKYTERGIVTEALLASLFGVDRYMVARAVQNSAAEGAAASMGFMAGKHAMLAHTRHHLLAS
jgi:hypothetical protein